MTMNLRGLNKNGRAMHWMLETAPMRDGWVCAEADGWLMQDPPGLDRTVSGLKATLRALERRGAVQLRTGTDGRMYARHVSRAGVPTEVRALLPEKFIAVRRHTSGKVTGSRVMTRDEVEREVTMWRAEIGPAAIAPATPDIVSMTRRDDSAGMAELLRQLSLPARLRTMPGLDDF